jgi:hypothetical protein
MHFMIGNSYKLIFVEYLYEVGPVVIPFYREGK